MIGDWAEDVLRRYGQAVTVRGAGAAETVRAFLQPAAEKGETAGTPTKMGYVDGRLWLYLGRRALEDRDIMEWNGLRLRSRSCRPYYVGGTLSPSLVRSSAAQ